MRHKRARLIEAGQLHAIFVQAQLFKERIGDLLRRAAFGVAGEAPVDVHVFRRPQTRAGVHGKTDRRGHNQNALARRHAAVALHLAQEGHQARADIELLHLVAAQRTQHSAAFLSLAESVSHDVHILAEIRRHGENHIFFHGHSFLHMRAISVPGYTAE